MRLPKIKLNIPFKKIGSVFLSCVTILFASLGFAGLAISLSNPVNLWWSISPIETPYYVVTYSSVMGYLEFIQLYYWYSVGISSAFIVFAYAIHIRSLRDLWTGIKKSPRTLLYSPIILYKEVVLFRDWLFNKIEYLNEQSAKWHRFFIIMKSPYSLLRSFGVSPQLAVAILGIGTASGTAVAVNEIIIERSFANGSPGIYSAPSEFPSEELEKELAWRKDNPDDNTLRIVLGTTPVEEISITDVSINSYANSTLPSGKAEAILIEGKNGMSARLEIGELMFDRNTCKSLTLSDINAHKIVIQHNISDGQSIAQTITTQRDLRISGGNFMARELSTSGGTYDRIWLDTGSLTSTNAKINKLNLSNIVSKGGTCVIRQADIGLLTIQYSVTGNDQNFATKEFTIASSTKAQIWNVNNNTEVLLLEPATQ